MNRATVYRIGNPLILAAIAVSGLMTNCDDCRSTKVESVDSEIPPEGQTVSVPGCVDTDTLHYKTTEYLGEWACQGMISGSEIALSYAQIGLCPMGQHLPQTQPFQVYWALCNAAKTRNDDASGAIRRPYQLRIVQRREDGQEVLLDQQLSFTTPTLDPCACETVIVVFNSPTDPDPNKKLLPGTYGFLLSEPYEIGKIAITTIDP